MKRDRAHAKARTATRGLLLRALVFLTLAAFTMQGFLTQTHIHAIAKGSPPAVDIFDGAPAPAGDKAPSKNDPANCPLCQQFASSGQFITPAAAAILLPSLAVSIIDVIVVATQAIQPVSHNWHGRAPPKA